ncbi:hypothetical protein [Nonomuraea sp. NEAU-A123]|nr:hypothetical protein [Nonomuraea sp. NEAU-A123]
MTRVQDLTLDQAVGNRGLQDAVLQVITDDVGHPAARRPQQQE